MSLYESTIPQMKKMLQNLERWLEAGVAHATQKSFDPAVLLASRLAPDQFSLLQQIQAAADQAKAAAARLAGKAPPSHPDTEKSLDEIRQRLKTVLTYLDTVTAGDFEGAEKRGVGLPFMPGKLMHGSDYATEMALPNFYFHVAMAYAILRHNGVSLGKPDYIGSLKLHDG